MIPQLLTLYAITLAGDEMAGISVGVEFDSAGWSCDGATCIRQGGVAGLSGDLAVGLCGQSVNTITFTRTYLYPIELAASISPYTAYAAMNPLKIANNDVVQIKNKLYAAGYISSGHTNRQQLSGGAWEETWTFDNPDEMRTRKLRLINRNALQWQFAKVELSTVPTATCSTGL